MWDPTQEHQGARLADGWWDVPLRACSHYRFRFYSPGNPKSAPLASLWTRAICLLPVMTLQPWTLTELGLPAIRGALPECLARDHHT